MNPNNLKHGNNKQKGNKGNGVITTYGNMQLSLF